MFRHLQSNLIIRGCVFRATTSISENVFFDYPFSSNKIIEFLVLENPLKIGNKWNLIKIRYPNWLIGQATKKKKKK